MRDVYAGEYKDISPNLATDPGVSTVYDPDPHHRFGYGYKARKEVNFNG